MLVSLARLEELIKLFTVTSVVLVFFIIIIFLLFTWHQAKFVKDYPNLLEHLLKEILFIALLTHIRKLHEDIMALEFVVGSAVIYGRVNKRNDGLSISVWVVEEVFGPISENFDFIINDVFEVIASK